MTHLNVGLAICGACGGTASGSADAATTTAGVADAGAQEVNARAIIPMKAQLHGTLKSVFNTQTEPCTLSWNLMFSQLAG